MSDLHKIMLTGHLGKEIERKDSDHLNEAKSTLAVTNSFKNLEGQWKTATTWYNLVFYNELADKALKLARGMKVFISGKVSVKTYMKDGEEKTYQKIVVQDFFVIPEIARGSKDAAKASKPLSHEEINNFDDDIPF